MPKREKQEPKPTPERIVKPPERTVEEVERYRKEQGGK